MENNCGSEKAIKDLHNLEEILRNCCDDINGYEFIPEAFSYNTNISGKKIIGIDKNLLSEVENLSKYDKKYLSALKMTVYHEIGHTKTYEKGQGYAFNEAIAELYAISKGSIEDYIIEISVISNIAENELSEFNQNREDPKDVIEYLLKHDSADKWSDREFASKFYKYKFARDALNKIKLSYREIFDRILKEREKNR